MSTYNRLGSLALVRQLIYEKENSEFKLLCLKIDLGMQSVAKEFGYYILLSLCQTTLSLVNNYWYIYLISKNILLHSLPFFRRVERKSFLNC